MTAAAALNYCPSGNICFGLGVPTTSASSGSGNIYFQISAPTSYSWIALGTGDRMSGSNMFVMYQDGDNNVTISPRQGTNHQMPVEDTSSTAAQLTLLEGSGVDGDTMRANVRCANCDSWANGGEMSLSSTNTPWIAGWKSGSSLATTDKNAAISQHDDYSSWNFDLTAAQVDTDANPFVSASTGGSGSGDSNAGSSGSGSQGSGNTGVTQNQSLQELPRLVAAHGVIMAIAFVILYPLGSILMPVLGKWMLHGAWQGVTFVLMWVGFAIGIVIVQRMETGLVQTHTIFGTVIVCLMVLQPVLGYMHHRHYVQHQARGAISYAHIVYGRVLMMLGVVNGGLGLQLANASNNLVIAYSVVAAIVFVLYVAVKGFTSFRKRRSGAGGQGKNLPQQKEASPPPREEHYEMPRRPYGTQREGGPGF
ncbi:uncharacterized protein BCR38DRAFT_354536 [Pseudomassariella vexata]|uniref:DOMON domain-containing protein n=1 Tax=Pseudomassariella vexata TaxID=1141098 RepID=A0A1Y2DE28_9PEZI|nr:uncharacterized protein BCR38DRAFT_354536 [Pseudomassariella vexata]ORY57532.1 hypothetical protein BCR38DRAFT_354536 [Pseudomassariella vexata]